MDHVIVDANVLVSFFVERSKERRTAAKALLRSAERGDFTAVVPQFVLLEVVDVLRNSYAVPGHEVARVVRDALEIPGSFVINDFPWTRIFDDWPPPFRSVSDAAIVALAVNHRYESVATFDRKLATRMKTLRISSYW